MPRPLAGRFETYFLHDEERHAYAGFDLGPEQRLMKPRLGNADASLDEIRAALHGAGRVAVVGQGTFGDLAAQALGELASEEGWRFGSGEKHYAIEHPKLQSSADGIYNRRGFSERGYRFGLLDTLQGMVDSGLVKALVVLHDQDFSSAEETERLLTLLQTVPFSLVLEVASSDLGRAASAQIPVATLLEESDAVTTHDGEPRPYQRALTAPRGILAAAEVAAGLAKAAVPA